MRFASAFDEALHRLGPPALFTLDPKGALRVDPERTREAILLVGERTLHEPAIYVLTDAATSIRMVLVVTHPDYATAQPRGEVRRFETLESACAYAVEQWRIPATETDAGLVDEP